jgi:hypothetical protein
MLLEKPVPGYGNLRLFVYSIIKKPRMSADVDKIIRAGLWQPVAICGWIIAVLTRVEPDRQG